MKIRQGFRPEEPTVRLCADSRHMCLVEDFSYISASGKIYTARKGLRSDGGSIPPIFWPVIGSPWTGKRRRAYIIHDQLCADLRQFIYQEKVDWFVVECLRKEADDLLYEMCMFLGDSNWSARAVWLGVRAGWYVSRLKYKRAHRRVMSDETEEENRGGESDRSDTIS
ncbi:MAG: DUF1353 domain-containing protein [Candidatus Methanomethylicaceae archaeon]